MKVPNPKLYAAAARDDDQRISKYSWAGGVQTDILPHHYAVFQCPNCLLADLKEKFENPGGAGAKENALFTSLKNAAFEKRLLLRKLHRFVPEGELDAQAAAALHLAALFCALLPGEKETIDHMKLGRLYLRLSWLYKEEKGEDTTEADKGDTAPTLQKIQQALELLQLNLSQVFPGNLGDIEALTSVRTLELRIPAEKNPYAKLTASLKEKMGQIQQTMALLQQAVKQDKQGKLTETVSAGNAESLEQLIPSLLPQWPQLPQTEEDAIKRAVDAFDYSFKFEDTGQTIQQSMAVVNLIIKLLLKLNDLDRALNYIMQIFKTGFRDKQDLQMRLNQGKRDKSMNEADQRNMTRQIGSVNATLSMAAETRRKIVALLYERDKQKIQQILQEKAEASSEEQEQAITSAGLSEELIPWLRENGLIKSDEKKKKWFGK